MDQRIRNLGARTKTLMLLEEKLRKNFKILDLVVISQIWHQNHEQHE